MESLGNKLSFVSNWPEEQTLPVIGDTYYQKRAVQAWDFIEIDEPIQIRKDLMIQNVKHGRLFWNINVALAFLADRLNPKNYLEIGVRTCGSLVSVLHNSNVKEIAGVDAWAGSYSGFPNTLKYAIEQVKRYQAKTNKKFKIKFIKGNSHTKLKDLIKAGEKFDLITVDGDHSEAGAWEDLKDAVKLLNEQAAIVFDDIIHPSHLYLKDLVDRLKREYPEFSILTNSRQDNGCAIFLKNIDVSRLLNGSPLGLSRCWCNGRLKDSVNPLYGQCQNCGTLVLKERPTKEQLKKFYSFDGYWHNHQVNISGYPPIEQRATDDFGNRIPVWYQLLRKYKPHLENLLEIGCAHGGFLHYCSQHGVKNVVGIEPDEQTCEFVRKHFNLSHIFSGLFPDVSLPFEKFDAVVGFDIIEHFLHPLEAMRKITDLLNDNGLCFFQIPCYRGEGRQWVQFRPDEHIFLYNSQSIRRLFDCAGLEITEILPGYFPDDVFVIGSKKIIHNLLFVRTDSIGDNVLAASMMPHIRQRFKNADITVVCQEHITELYQACPFVDNIVAFNKKRAYQDKQYRDEIVNRLRALKPELSLNPVFSRETLTDVFAIECNAKERIACEGNLSNISAQQRSKHNQFYTRLLPNRAVHKPELDRHRDFLHGMGIDVPSLRPVIWTTAEDKKFADEFFKDNGLEPEQTVALFAGAQRQVRLYDKYGESLSELCQKNNLKVIALGAEQEFDINQKNLNDIGVETFNLSGKTTIRQSAAVLKCCRLAVGAETGLAHISCAVRTPNVILLGGGHFGRFMPYSSLTSIVCLPLQCYGCEWKCRYERVHCIKDVKPEVFADVIRQTFESPSEKPRVFVQDSSLWKTDTFLPEWRPPGDLSYIGAVEIIPVGPAAPAIKQDRQIEIPSCEDKYLVSAIVSTYNSEKFIRGCLEDLENQTIADKLEIIVIDSGSKENEQAVVNEFQQKYDNIKYVRTEHREGIYTAWNRALKLAQGRFITNANTDDRHREDALQLMANELLANLDIALVYTDQIQTNTPNETFANHHGTEILQRPDYNRQRLLSGCCVGSQPMWRRSLHEEFGYFNESLTSAADWDFWLRISDKYEFKRIPEFCGLYYYNKDGIEHGRKVHSLYERYIVGKQHGTPYISSIPLYSSQDNPLISVIIPAYNSGRYIAETIESVLIQNYRNLEIIIVDDGSTDNTRDIVNNFQDERIKYYYQENAGPAAARNLAIRNAQGSFLVSLDSDDMITPNFIARNLAEFEKHPETDLVYCDHYLIDDNSRFIRVIPRPDYIDQRLLIRDLFRCGYLTISFTACFRKSVFDKIGLFDQNLLIAEDYDMMRRFIKKGLKIHHLKAAIYLRRIRPGNISRNYNVEKAKSHLEAVKRFTETFSHRQLFPDVAWHKIAPEKKQIYADTLIATTYIRIGQSYTRADSLVLAQAVFDLARSQLNKCIEAEPENQLFQQLLQKSELLQAKYADTVQQAVC